jgi:hypothetical protein
LRFGSVPICVSQSTAAQNVVCRCTSSSRIFEYTSRHAGVLSAINATAYAESARSKRGKFVMGGVEY